MTALLLSGGLDSAAIAWWKRPNISFFIDYGQIPAAGERRSAQTIAQSINSELIEINVDCGHLGSGTLVHREPEPAAPSREWWPFRNQLLLTLAASTALRLNVKEIYFGSVLTDGFHKDGTEAFFEAANALTAMQEGEIKVSAPAINMRCEDVLKLSGIPNELMGLTHSCHVHEYACGLCEGCLKHFAVLRILGIEY
jgi:7-cyano-7-deazaguanine synthase